MRNPSAAFAIEAIDEALTEEEKELLAIPRGETKITFKQILKGRYGRLYSRYSDKDEIIVRAATIMDNNKHNLAKLKKREELIEKLIDLESFVTVNKLQGKSKKDSGIISTADSSSESISAGHTKSREGSSQYGIEFLLEDTGDREDSDLLESVLKLKAKSAVQNKGAFNDDRKLELTQTEEKPPVPAAAPTPGAIPHIPPSPDTPQEQEPAAPQNPVEPPPKPLIDIQNLEGKLDEEQVYLHSVALASGRNAGVAKGVSTSIAGRTIKSDSEDEVTKKTFVEGRAADAVQKLQLVNFRERIINQFKTLFTEYPCQ